MSIKQGDAVVLTCEGQSRSGTITLCSPNRQSLVVKLSDGLPTPQGMYVDSVLLLMKDDGEYHDLAGDFIVEIAFTQ
jgi:hypothetical protein